MSESEKNWTSREKEQPSPDYGRVLSTHFLALNQAILAADSEVKTQIILGEALEFSATLRRIQEAASQLGVPVGNALPDIRKSISDHSGMLEKLQEGKFPSAWDMANLMHQAKRAYRIAEFEIIPALNQSTSRGAARQ